MDKRDFLLEIGCEELPTFSLQPMADALCKEIEQELAKAELAHHETQKFATPRRIAILISDLSTQQKSRMIERLGPSIKNAYDKDGAPTLACIGFARSINVSIDQLEVKKTDKGERVCVTVQHPGEPTKVLLPTIVGNALKKVHVSKPMRWGEHDFSFIRPVHWVVMLFGKELIDTHILGKQTTTETQGHRFHHPNPIRITEPKDYNVLLYSKGYVIPDFQTRKELIRKSITQKTNQNERAIVDDNLLEEVTSLVEWPVVLEGKFDPRFLKVPKEVLITSMETHQKCFPVENARGELLPKFILVSNIESKDPNTVIQGNERVINARLADADFFFKNDLKRSLESRLTRLEHVIFQNKLGTIAEKSKRLSKLTALIAKQIGVDPKVAKRCGLLAKCDLVSEMVYEFPKLQGIMGYYYAMHDKEQRECATAIAEHYMPQYSGALLPDTLLGCAVALADRLDTLIGILGINETPSGDKDPFALRRASQGIFRILIEKELSLNLMQLLQQALEGYEIELPNKDVVTQAFEFILGRLKYWYIEQGVGPEVFEAVLANRPTVPLDFHHRLQAVRQFQTLPEASALAAANKRVSNILKKTEQNFPDHADISLFEADEERQLSKLLDQQAEAVRTLYEASDYTQALSQLSSLKEPIDAFFDHVMVMVDEEKTRKNRLALLASFRKLFTQVADISLL